MRYPRIPAKKWPGFPWDWMILGGNLAESQARRETGMRAENLEWLEAQIKRGDDFGISTNPSKLPPVKMRAGDPIPDGGYFTARESQTLTDQGITPKAMYQVEINSSER